MMNGAGLGVAEEVVEGDDVLERPHVLAAGATGGRDEDMVDRLVSKSRFVINIGKTNDNSWL